MIKRQSSAVLKPQPRIVAAFGRSLLVRVAPYSYRLHSASAGDLTSAKEWVSLFMHEAVLTEAPRLF
jgi:hypothetical protein